MVWYGGPLRTDEGPRIDKGLGHRKPRGEIVFRVCPDFHDDRDATDVGHRDPVGRREEDARADEPGHWSIDVQVVTGTAARHAPCSQRRTPVERRIVTGSRSKRVRSA